MSLKAKDVALKIKSLASLPEVCIKINELADDPNVSTNDIKKVIETDPAISAKLLQIANSSYFGHVMRVEDLNRAIMLIGTQGLRDLVWAMSSITTFSNLNADNVDMRKFWEHSLYTGLVAKILSKKCHVINQDRLFLSGLLHDIGHLALYQVMPEEMEVSFIRAKENQEHLIIAEKSVLGFTHPAVSYGLLKMWKLPDSICQSVAYHHQPGKCDAYRLDTSIVHLSDNIAKMADKSSNYMENQIDIDSNAWKTTGLTDKIIDSVIQIANEQYNDAVSVYLPSMGIAPAA